MYSRNMLNNVAAYVQYSYCDVSQRRVSAYIVSFSTSPACGAVGTSQELAVH